MRISALIFLMLALHAQAGPLFMALLRKPAVSSTGIALIASTFSALGASGGSTSAINTTGANFVAVNVTYFSGATGLTVSDNKGNTYTSGTSKVDTGSGVSQIFYSRNATTGSGHTFTVGGTGVYASVFVEAFSHLATTGTADNQIANANASSNTIQPGSLTPSTANELYVSTLECGTVNAGTTVDSGLTITGNVQGAAGTNYGGAMGYKLLAAPSAINPTWTNSSAGATGMVSTGANFK